MKCFTKRAVIALGAASIAFLGCTRITNANIYLDGNSLLGRAEEGRVDLVVSVAPALVARGVKAGVIVKLAAAEVGGGGGGRDTMARAGGRDPERLPEAISAAQAAIEAALRA